MENSNQSRRETPEEALAKKQMRVKKVVFAVAVALVLLIGIVFCVERYGKASADGKSAGGQPDYDQKCLTTLKQTMLGVVMYAMDHNEYMPADLAMVAAEGYMEKTRCPAGSEFVYLDLGNMLKIDDQELPVVICPWHLNYAEATGAGINVRGQEARPHTCDEFVKMLGRQLPAGYLEKLRQAWR